MTWSSHAIPVAYCSCSSLREVLAHHPHAQPLAIEGQKKGGRTIFGSRRLLDVGNRRGDLDGDNVAGLAWVPEFRYGLRILPKVSSRRVASHSVGAPYNSPIHISSRNKSPARTGEYAWNQDCSCNVATTLTTSFKERSSPKPRLRRAWIRCQPFGRASANALSADGSPAECGLRTNVIPRSAMRWLRLTFAITEV